MSDKKSCNDNNNDPLSKFNFILLPMIVSFSMGASIKQNYLHLENSRESFECVIFETVQKGSLSKIVIKVEFFDLIASLD